MKSRVMNQEEQIKENQEELKALDTQFIKIYKKEMLDALKYSFPELYGYELEQAVNYSIEKRAKNSNVVLDNNYEKRTENTTLYRVLDYIIDKEPIITVSGVMFKKHGTCPNPYVDLIQEFLSSRTMYKNEMFKYPKGSTEFEKYNLLQLAEKVSANASYGASGNHTSIFYNLYVAQSITMQGRSCISAAIMLFEATMANNVKFGSLNEVIMFINNILREERVYDDHLIIDEGVSVANCFAKVISSCGFYYVPSEKDMMIIWDMLNQMNQQDLNRIYYKNNLYYFIDNSYVMNALVDILSTLETPFINPNTPPEEIKDKLNDFYELFKEWVYYDKQYMDRIDRAENMFRCVSVLTDTDSCFISFDGWYRYILDRTYDIPMKIKELEVNSDTGEVQKSDTIRYDYNFFTDEIIELESDIRPNIIGPGAGFRCSIINILAHIMGKLSIDYMNKYARNSNSTITYDGTERVSYFILKNEFQLKRALIIPDSKKNYCAYQERQENSFIPIDKAMSVTGMPITKVGLPENTKVRLKQILFDYVLNAGDNISQVDIVKQLAVLEKQIFQAILSGSKDYFKPVRIKSEAGYDDPMGQFGIKASIAYNALKENEKEPIDLTQRNSILVIKTDINQKNVDQIKNDYPDQYNKILNLFQNKYFAKGIDKVALPENEEVPEWIKVFINYTEIINDNLKTFPCEALGICRKDKDSVNYTNIINI